MNRPDKKSQLWHTFANDYGMVFVLLLLIAVLSVLTLEEQHPAGEEAGAQVAGEILRSEGEGCVVAVVAESTAVDEAFVRGAVSQLEAGGAVVATSVAGRPVDARRAIEKVLTDGGRIDAVAVTADAAKWTIFTRIEGVQGKCVGPRSYSWPTFARLDNLVSVANQTAIYAIIAIGMTMVIVTAGIDLSVGSLVALASVAAAMLIRDQGGKDAGLFDVFIAGILGIALCATAGLFNGLMITRFRIPPFIATLAMMMMARGLARQMAAEESISNLPETFKSLGGTTLSVSLFGSSVGIPNPVILMVLLYIGAHVLMSMTVLGRYVYAVGGNPEAARLSGVKVKSVTIMVYTICGALAGLGGIMQASKLGAGDPKLGMMLELDVISAVVVGGTSLMGGEGKVFGTLIGAFIIAVIRNGMNLMNVGAANQLMVLGAVLLLSVMVDMAKRPRTHG